MDVFSPRKGLAQLRLARDVSEDPQLDLRVVGRDELPAGLGGEGGPDLAPELRSDRDRLQVRVRGREPPRRSDRLVEGSVQAAVLAEQRRQRSEGGVEELRVLPPLL